MRGLKARFFTGDPLLFEVFGKWDAPEPKPLGNVGELFLCAHAGFTPVYLGRADYPDILCDLRVVEGVWILEASPTNIEGSQINCRAICQTYQSIRDASGKAP